MASLARNIVDDSGNSNNRRQIDRVNKYRKQLLQWKTDKHNDFKNNKKNIQDKFGHNIKEYDKHLEKKIYDKLLEKILLIYPSEASNEDIDVDLGFCEGPYDGPLDKMKHTHTNKNWSMWDGGLVGGTPIWLNPNKLPSKDRLVCGSCNTKMLFLLQLYAPIDDEINHKNAFHRTIYVFCCKNEKCHTISGSNAFRVFRSQLPRKNMFYPFDELSGEQIIFSDSSGKIQQQYNNKNSNDDDLNFNQLKVFEIVSELEIDCLKDANASINKRFKDVIGEQIKKTKIGDKSEEEEEDVAITQSDIDGVMNTITCNGNNNGYKQSNTDSKNTSTKNALVSKCMDKSMVYFHHRIDIAKDQILRYARWKTGEELFFSDKNRPNVLETIPRCPSCDGSRAFEFQIMPQLLSYLNVEDIPGLVEIDWGGLYIYTCINSCNNGDEEYLWIQPST